MMISVITITLGRELYMKRLFESIDLLGGDRDIEHFVIFQGQEPSSDLLSSIESREDTIVEVYPEIKSDRQVLKEVAPKMSGSLVLRLDDDCVIRSPEFFSHASYLHSKFPQLTFSPFPVGLINSLGGVQSNQREVFYGEEMDTYYTFRSVHHIGGFARFCPAPIHLEFAERLSLDSQDGEDVQLSHMVMSKGLPMAYLENAMIVEHQESSLGQAKRYGETYNGYHGGIM